MRNIDLLLSERVRLPREVVLEELREDLKRSAIVRGDFVLSSGIHQDYYIDKYLFVAKPAVLRRLGRFLGELVPPDTDRVAAPALGAVALGTAVSLDTGLPLVIVRPQVASDPERQRMVEGGLFEGEKVTLIEDVVVTGSRATRAVTRLSGVGAEVVSIVAVIDCLDAASRFQEMGIQYGSLFTIDQFRIT